MNFEIRGFQEKDYFNVVNLAPETGSESEEIKEILKNDLTYVLELNNNSRNKFAGFISFHKENKSLKITELAIEKEFRNMGLGKKLLEFSKEFAIKNKLEKITVETSNDNIPSLLLYQRFGFIIKMVEIGKLVEHHGKEEIGFKGIPVRDSIILEMEI